MKLSQVGAVPVLSGWVSAVIRLVLSENSTAEGYYTAAARFAICLLQENGYK